MAMINNKTATPLTEADAKNVVEKLNDFADDWSYVMLHMSDLKDGYELTGGTKDGRYAADYGNAYNVAVFDEGHEFLGYL